VIGVMGEADYRRGSIGVAGTSPAMVSCHQLKRAGALAEEDLEATGTAKLALVADEVNDCDCYYGHAVNHDRAQCRGQSNDQRRKDRLKEP
jgi:hypothetical protein